MSQARVLIVEDDVITAADLKASLEGFGYEVCGVLHRAEEVEAAVRRQGPDLVLMDIVLGGKQDGIDMGARLGEAHEVPVVFLTAHADEGRLQRALQSKPYGFVVKPFSTVALRASVEMALSLSRTSAARKRAELELMRSEAALRGILDATFETILVMAPDGTILECNQAMSRNFGREQSELIGCSAYDLIPETLAQQRRAIVEEVVITGQPVRFEDQRGEHVIDQTVFPIFDEHGRVERLSIFARDVTEERRILEQLQESEQRCRIVVESVPNSVLTIAKGRFTYANPAAVRMFGLQGADELVGRPVLELIAPEYHDVLRARMAKLEQGMANDPLEIELLRSDGRRLTVETISAPITVGGEEMSLVVGQDVTERKLAEEALRRSEERFRTVADFTYDWEYWLGANGSLFYISPSSERITGYATDAFVTRPELLTEIVLEEDRARLQEVMSSEIGRRQSVATEFRIVRRDGSIRWIGHACQPVYGDDGSFQGTRVSNRDITERKLAEERLRESEELHRQTLQAISEAVLLVDRAGRVVFFSGHVEGVLDLGEQRAKLDEKTNELLQQLPVLWQSADPGAKPQEHSVRLTGNDGSEKVLGVNVRPVEIRGCSWLLTVRDVTVRAAMEEMIRRSASDWQTTFDCMDDAVLLFDEHDRLYRLNEAGRRLFGRPYELLLERSLDELGTADVPFASVAEALKAVRNRGEAPVRRTPLREDQTCWEVSARLLPTIHDKPGVVVTVRDVSAQSLLQEKLRRSELMSTLGSVVAGVAHEVRNPLFSISATVDALEACHAEAVELQPFCQGLRVQVGRLQTLMSELLEFGRPRPSGASECRLSEILREATAVTGVLASERELRFELVGCEPQLSLLAQAESLVTALRNLLANACHHAPAGSVITIECRRAGQEAVVAVRDRGPGFAEESLPRIFDPFYSSRRGGTGLGLAIVQRVVELHEGSVTAYNHPTGGAVVELRLPCASALEVPDDP